jgi:acetyl/propionyl-CoA carboxylase alpha subunit
MGRALDEVVVLGCVTNIRFLRELCEHKDVVEGWTTTDMIARLWPDGWTPDQSSIIGDAGLLIASSCEASGYGKKVFSSEISQISPFTTLNRRFP